MSYNVYSFLESSYIWTLINKYRINHTKGASCTYYGFFREAFSLIAGDTPDEMAAINSLTHVAAAYMKHL